MKDPKVPSPTPPFKFALKRCLLCNSEPPRKEGSYTKTMCLKCFAWLSLTSDLEPNLPKAEPVIDSKDDDGYWRFYA